MKHLSLIFFLYGVLGILYAQNSIDDEIAQIMKAPPQERVLLMNQLKSKIAEMNEQERSSAIRNMQLQMNTMPDASRQPNRFCPPFQRFQQFNSSHQRPDRRQE